MSRKASPAMPTKRQIEDAYSMVKDLCPEAKIASVGPEGVTFVYPADSVEGNEWQGTPFSAE